VYERIIFYASFFFSLLCTLLLLHFQRRQNFSIHRLRLRLVLCKPFVNHLKCNEPSETPVRIFNMLRIHILIRKTRLGRTHEFSGPFVSNIFFRRTTFTRAKILVSNVRISATNNFHAHFLRSFIKSTKDGTNILAYANKFCSLSDDNQMRKRGTEAYLSRIHSSE